MAGHDTGASSSSSVGTETPITYDVFLNFKGEDTRNNFTGFLHRALKRERINVFMDNEELCGGEEIRSALLQAIRGSRISIPVFSKGYADSKWCLLELVEIVRCHRSNGQLILPIFLDDVEPTHVRHQTKSYFEVSFQKHQEKFDVETIKSWKEALNVVGGLRGYELKQVNGNQSKLIDLVVDKVLSESSSNRLGDIKNPIGLDARVKDLLRLLNVGSDDIQFVGICGIGGIGKTTIAKALYNHILKNFHSFCFLANIKEIASRPNGLVSLQEQLIWSVSKKKVDNEIRNVDRGQELIKERLQGENVLLILDDVDDRSQLKALAIEFNWFGSGSRIIITSRDEHILNVAKVDGGNIYWPEELDDEQSLQLFSLHAFSRDQPPEDYKQLSKDVLNLAGRLPLTLEVLGSAFCDIREKEEWQSKLEDLKRIPHEEVLQKLKISYDNLKENEKYIFLDAACFFVGWRKETIISIWDACGFNPVSAIKKLTQRSLIKFTNNSFRSKSYDELRMHDQIQAMGRSIVYGENLKEPGERSRLWSRNDILELLEEHKGTQKIEGILLPFKHELFPRDECLHKDKFAVCLHKEDFAIMSKLRFLYIREACFGGDFPNLPSSLRWLSWERCLLETEQYNFYHKKLAYMDLSKSQIRQAWTNKPHNENQRFQNLKVLRLQNCMHLSESPDFSWFPYLETLNLSWCENMVSLHKSIGDLKYLIELDLHGTKIKELPDSTCKLGSLKCLFLGSCSLLEKLPQSVGDLKSLVELDLNGCNLLNKLPELPSKLTHFNVGKCISLQKLPDLSSLKNLRNIYLSNIKKLEEIQGLGGTESLERFFICDCDNIESISELPSSLTWLEVTSCSSLQKLPDFSSLKNLRILSLIQCQKLEEIQGLEGTESLECFLVLDCETITNTPMKILGQGTLLVDPFSGRDSLNVNDGKYKGLILCIVFNINGVLPQRDKNDNAHLTTWCTSDGVPVCCGPCSGCCTPLAEDRTNGLDGKWRSIVLEASICRRHRRTKCCFEITVDNTKSAIRRDIIYIHHFKGFDLFGLPLEGIDAIEEIRVTSSDFEVKFWKLMLLENTKPEQEMPSQECSARMEADFFEWSYYNDDDYAGPYPSSDVGEAMLIGGFLDPQSEESDDEIDSHYVPGSRDSQPPTNEEMLTGSKRACLDVDEATTSGA